LDYVKTYFENNNLVKTCIKNNILADIQSYSIPK
jgi:hypothetical protein